MTYKIIMSSGPFIPIDADEMRKVLDGATRKALVIVRQGLINPAHMISIVEDHERNEGQNYQLPGGDYRPSPSAARPVQNIFEGIADLLPQQPKQLS